MIEETAIITGGTSGIGKKLAEVFLQQGFMVSICSRSQERVDNTIDELKEYGNIIGFTCDVTKPDELENLIDKTVEEFGSIRIMIANAGLNRRYGPFGNMAVEMVSEDAQIVLSTNLTGLINTISSVLPQMKKQKYGRIITLSGGGADRPLPNMSIYSASKGGVVSFSKCLAEELKEDGLDIKINIFNPGMHKTGLGKDIKLVPNWLSREDHNKRVDLVHEYSSADLEESCRSVIPYVIPECKKNGKSFNGFSVFKLVFGMIKLQKKMKTMD